jgi:putative protease
MSAKDMCLISDLQALMLADVSAFKIEGRMKSEHYIATVVNAYKHVKNSIVHNQPADHKYVDDVVKAANRQVSCG